MQTEQSTASVWREGDRIEELLSTAALQEKDTAKHTVRENEKQDEKCMCMYKSMCQLSASHPLNPSLSLLHGTILNI